MRTPPNGFRLIERHRHEGWLRASRSSAVGRSHDVEVDIPGLLSQTPACAEVLRRLRTYDMQRLLKEVLDGNQTGIVYTSEYTLDDIQEAYAAMDERRTVKPKRLRISEAPIVRRSLLTIRTVW